MKHVGSQALLLVQRHAFFDRRHGRVPRGGLPAMFFGWSLRSGPFAQRSPSCLWAFCSPAFCFRWTDFNTLRDRHAWGLPFCDTLSRNGRRPRTCLGLPVSFFCVDARHVSGFCVLRVMEWVRPWGTGLVCRTRAIASFKIRSDTALCRFLVVVA